MCGGGIKIAVMNALVVYFIAGLINYDQKQKGGIIIHLAIVRMIIKF